MTQAPIAVFDSGLGGLTVLRALALALPSENFVYLGDTARVPYGSKSPLTIRKYSEQILAWLMTHHKPKLIVVACNSASAQISEKVWQGRPLFNVIDPGVTAALQVTKNGLVGLLGTRATVQSGEYERRLEQEALKRGRKISCFARACSLLVPLVEEGWLDDPITNLIVHRYLNPLVQRGVDTVILGCTHYPILMGSLRKTAGQGIQLIEAGPFLAAQIREARIHPNLQAESGTIQIFLTDPAEHSRTLARGLLHPIEIDGFAAATVETL